MTIRQLKKSDVKEYRRLRLEALRKAPLAFGSSYAEEKKLPLTAFVERLSAKDVWVFGAFAGERLVGIVGFCREGRIKRAHNAALVGMYVSAAVRGHGIGAVLLDRTIEHARLLKSVRNIRLSVIAGNEAARALYLSRGFKTFGVEREALFVDDRYLDEEHMTLTIHAGAASTVRSRDK